jgi:Zn-dependent metalloprotease
LQTHYLPPDARLFDARTASIQAATDLYGENSPEVRAVTQAWSAVGVQ